MDTRASSRVILAAAMAVSIGTAGVRAGTSPATRVLPFPRNECMGSLYVDDPCLGSECMELGRDLSLPFGLNPKGVALGGDYDFAGRAQGDVAVPAGRNVKLIVMLRLPQDRNKRAALPPRLYRMFGTDRCREDPEDLLGLSMLDPNDLWGITVNSLVPTARANEQVLEPISRLTGLHVLELHGTGITDKGMELLKPLRSLGALEFIDEPFVGNRGLAVLKDLPNLEYLDLDKGVTDAGLKHVGQVKSVRWLRLRTGRIWGPGLAELAHLPQLERLCIWGSDQQFSDRHIQYLEGLTHLKSLTLWAMADGLTDASLASISKLKNLEELHFIITSPRFTPAGVAHLRNLKKLRKIDFGHAWSGRQGVSYGDEVARQLAGLCDLESIQGVGYLSAEGMEALAALQNLKRLDVALKDHHQGYDGPTCLSHLSKVKSLEELHFTGGKSLSDGDLAQLESLGNLKHLSFGLGEATDRGMVSLGKLRRLEHLTIGSHGGVTKRGLNELKGLTDLQTLDINVFSEGEPTIDEIPLSLSSLKKLKTLELQGVSLRDADLGSLAGLSDLEWLALDGSFTENGLWHLKGLDSLKWMLIDKISCSSGEGLAHLAGFPRIGDLHVHGQVTDAALSKLTGSPSLWSFSVTTDEPIRRETIDRFKQTLPNVEYIHIDPLPRLSSQRFESSSQQPRPVRPNSPRINRPTPQNPRRLR